MRVRGIVLTLNNFSYLLCFAMKHVLLTPRAELLDFQPIGIVPAVFLRCIVAFFALGASERDDWSNVFLSHN